MDLGIEIATERHNINQHYPPFPVDWIHLMGLSRQKFPILPLGLRNRISPIGASPIASAQQCVQNCRP